ncbi:MAG: Flp pilus assembly complex ATPase component TadA [Planctomycetes bacterium]|nr:Flp pilus assembly complex ATPase component TadA [Planctomycetota bacterium]
MVQERKPLGKILELMKVVNPKQVKEALQVQHDTPGKKIGEILIEKGWATSGQVTEALAKQFEMPFVDLANMEIADEIISAIPHSVATEHKIVPVKKNGRTVTIAMSDPLDLFTLDNLRFILNTEVECVLATREDVTAAIEKFYGGKAKDALGNVLEELTSSDITVRGAEEGGEEGPVEDDAPVIRLVTLVISEAVRLRASDIHVEPMEKKLRIRYRVDGLCIEVESPPKRLQGSVLSRIKIMSEMDIAEKRKPQDGRIKIQLMGKDLDLRVSALPCTHGESIVMRILDKQASLVGLDELGLHQTDFTRFKGIIKRPNGIFLVTGPTGSGKTTTLYAALKDLNKSDVKIITAENPVEYVLAGVNQAQVKQQIGMTFARIIRAMLRQAPNIILVGEIRDTETAEIAIQAALTGHLVFSTLHTNDAPSAISRLIDMGVKPFLVASSIQAILAQRLVRMLCQKCKVPYEPEPQELMALNMKPEDLQGQPLYKPGGCDECSGKGYRSRKGIFELMEMNAVLREMAFKKEPTMKLREVARQNGMLTLLEDGVRKVLEGRTSIAEVLNLTHREDITYG